MTKQQDDSMTKQSSTAVKSKRKAEDAAEESGSENDQSDVEMIDVDFDFFDPQSHDYHSIKLLLSQLLSRDAALLDLGGVTDLILEQKLVGTTVKTDGHEGDPYAVLTILNLTIHRANPAIASLVAYLLSKSSSDSSLHASLTELFALPSTTLSSSSKPQHIGLVLSERMVNMPAQLAQPMYRMLREELGWAKEANTPYHFSHLLFLSRVFVASPDSFDEDPNAAMTVDDEVAEPTRTADGKRNKKKKAKNGGGSLGKPMPMEEQVWVYHPEDDFIETLATNSLVFKYTTQGADGRAADSFGVETRGKLMLVPYSKFDTLVDGMDEFLMKAE